MSKEVHPKKGKKNGRCNRVMCQQPSAMYYNPSTMAWYCPKCANRINEANPGLCYIPEGVFGDE